MQHVLNVSGLFGIMVGGCSDAFHVINGCVRMISLSIKLPASSLIVRLFIACLAIVLEYIHACVARFASVMIM